MRCCDIAVKIFSLPDVLTQLIEFITIIATLELTMGIKCWHSFITMTDN